MRNAFAITVLLMIGSIFASAAEAEEWGRSKKWNALGKTFSGVITMIYQKNSQSSLFFEMTPSVREYVIETTDGLFPCIHSGIIEVDKDTKLTKILNGKSEAASFFDLTLGCKVEVIGARGNKAKAVLILERPSNFMDQDTLDLAKTKTQKNNASNSQN